MKNFFASFKKELSESLGGQKIKVTSILFFIIGASWWILPIISTNADIIAGKRDALTLPVIGRQHAPDLIAYLLERRGISLEIMDGDAETQIQERKAKFILSIPADDGAKISGGQQETVDLYIHGGSLKARLVASRIEHSINVHYSRDIAPMKLRVHAVNPSFTHAVKVKKRDFFIKSKFDHWILMSSQVVFLLLAFLGVESSIDHTADDRECKSPGPFQMMNGKGCALLGIPLILTLIRIVMTMAYFQLLALVGEALNFTGLMQLNLLAAIVPLPLLGTSLMILQSIYAKKLSGFQAFSGVVVLVTVPVLVTDFMELEAATWMYFVPVFSQQQLLTSVLRGEVISAVPAILSASVTALFALGLFALIPRILRGQRVVYKL